MEIIFYLTGFNGEYHAGKIWDNFWITCGSYGIITTIPYPTAIPYWDL